MLIIDINNFELSKRNEITDETGKVQFWTQPDFAYKQRVHIYDCLDNEIGYVQYKVLSIQNGNEIHDKEDKLIDINGFKKVNSQSNWNYEIEYNGAVICCVNEGKIEIVDNSDINKCLLFIFSLIEKGE